MITYEIIQHHLEELTPVSTVLRLFLAALCGGMIGMERGRRRRAAGLRTHMLVCIGAALVMITNQYMVIKFGSVDPARLGAQVISGIGFLGVGTIIVDRQQQVRGLTTAAGLWACACMGLALGIGFYLGALVAFGLILSTIIVLNRFEQLIISRSKIMDVYAEFEDHREIPHFVKILASDSIKVENIEIVQPRNHQGKEDMRAATIMTLRLPKRHQHSKILEALDDASGLLTIEELR